MPAAKQQAIIVKIPNTNKRLPSQQSFPPLPKLYNELIVNKEKIYPKFHDVEFTPTIQQRGDQVKGDHQVRGDHQVPVVSPSDTSSNQQKNQEPVYAKKFDILNKIRSNIKDDDAVSVESIKSQPDIETQSVASIVSGISIDEVAENQSKGSENRAESPGESPGNGFKDKLQEYFSSTTESNKIPSLTPDAKYSIPKPQTPSLPSQFVPQPVPQSIPQPIPQPQPHESPTGIIPPSLDQIKSGIPNQSIPAANLNTKNFREEQDEEDEKRKIAHSIDLLREAYPKYSSKIPDYNLYTDLKTMRQIYDDGKRRAKIEHSIDRWRRYLGMGFGGVEFILGTLFRLDMQGFARHQVSNMSNYDHLLVEMSEKNYMPKGSNFPVELQLLFAIIVQAGSFVVWKKISARSGLDASVFNLDQNSSNSTGSNRPKNNVRMKEPDISLDDI